MVKVTLESESILTTDRRTQQLYDNLLKILTDLGAINSAAALIQQQSSGTYGSATTTPKIVIDSKGNIISITDTTITGTPPGGAAGGDLAGTYPNPTVVPKNLLSAAHADTVAAAVVRGDLMVGNATPKWDKLAVGAVGTVLIGGTDPTYSSSPTISVSVTTPSVIGGTAINSTLILQATSAAAGTTTDAIIFNIGDGGGTEAMQILHNGDVGIGIAAATARLHVKGSGATIATYSLLVQNSTPVTTFSVRDDGYINFGQFHYRTDLGTGRVGIGILTPNYLFEVSQENSISTPQISVSNINTTTDGYGARINWAAGSRTFAIWNNNEVTTTYGGDGAVNIFNQANAPIIFTTNSIERVRINSGTGATLNVTGTGTISTSTTTPLVIGGTAVGSSLELRSTSGVGTTDFIKVCVGNNGGTEAMRVINSGYVGIGTATPSCSLEITQSMTASGAVAFKINDGVTGGFWSIGEGSSVVGGYIPAFRTLSAGINGYGTIYRNEIPTARDVFAADGAAIILDGRDTAGTVLANANLLKVKSVGTTYMTMLAGGSLIIGSPTALVATEFVSIQKDQNAITQLRINNATSGPAGRSSIFASTGTTGLAMHSCSATYTTSGILVASTSVLSSTMTEGLNIGTIGATQLSFWTNNTKHVELSAVGNLSLGGTAVRGTTVGTYAMQIFNGTAPVGTLTNGVSLYAVAGKLWAMDAAGVATQLTP